MQKSSEFDEVNHLVATFLSQFTDQIEKMLGLLELDKPITDNSDISAAYNSGNTDILDVRLQERADIQTVQKILNAPAQKGIGIPIFEPDVVTQHTVALLNLILDDLYGEQSPIKVNIEQSQDKQFYLFLYSKEPIAKLDQIQVIIEKINNRLEAIQELLLTESAWQLYFTGTAYFHTTVPPSIIYSLMTLYAVSKLQQGIELESIDHVQWDMVTRPDGGQDIKGCYFSGDSIRQILCQQFGLKNLYLPFDQEGKDSELIKLCKLAGEASARMLTKQDMYDDIRIQLVCLNKILVITAKSPSMAMFHKHQSLGKVSLELQLIMDDFAKRKEISVKDALGLKREIETIRQIYDQVSFDDIYDKSVGDVIKTRVNLSTIPVLSISDNEIIGFSDDVKRKKSIEGGCYNLNFLDEILTRLSVYSRDCIRLKKLDRLDLIWLAYTNELKIFFSKLLASCVGGVGGDARLQLEVLSGLMVKILALDNTLKARPWQNEMLALLCNTLSMLSLPLSQHKHSLFITRYIAGMLPTSKEFVSACAFVGVDLMECFKNLINISNQLLYINRAAYVVNTLYRSKTIQPNDLIDACTFLLQKLGDCKVDESMKKNVRENLTKLRGVLSKQMPVLDPDKKSVQAYAKK